LFDHPFTESLVEAIQQDPQFKNMGVAIIDLTLRTRRADGSGFMTFAGWNVDDMRFAASMLKITAMFAAFRLRHNVRAAAAAVDLTGVSDRKKEKALWDAIAKDWKPVVEHAVPDGRPDFPQLDRMFDVHASDNSIQFSPAMAKHILAMIAKSNTYASGQVINALGFQYLNGALQAEGLFDRSSGGLWLGANYNGRNWKKEPITNITHIGATAAATAQFLALLEDNRLVSAAASDQMRQLMWQAGSWFRDGLDKAQRRPSKSYTKVGQATGGNDPFVVYSECGVFERSSSDGSRFRYALVGLSARSDDSLRKLAVKADEYVRISSGPPSLWP
jgi:hypothetical protein